MLSIVQEAAVTIAFYFFFTHVSDVLPNRLSLNQRGDSEAVVPVATTEE